VLSGFSKLAIISTASKLAKNELNLITDMANKHLYYLGELKKDQKKGTCPKKACDRVRKKSKKKIMGTLGKVPPEELTL